MEQHEPKGKMLFCPGNVTNLLDVTLSNPLPHPLSPPPIPLGAIIWLLSNIQQRVLHTFIARSWHQRMSKLVLMC